MLFILQLLSLFTLSPIFSQGGQSFSQFLAKGVLCSKRLTIEDEHPNNKDEIKFSWKIRKKHKKPLQRQLHEAVRIKHKCEGESLNSKYEYLSQRINRINIEKQTQVFHCETCGSKQNSDENLKLHRKKFHVKVPCGLSECSYTAIGENDLKEHSKYKHNNKK